LPKLAKAVQAYTTLGPAGAGTYRESTQRDNYSTTGKANPHIGTVGARNQRYVVIIW
jgi:hypothetical protein